MSLLLWGVLKNLNLNGLDLESARNSEPASDSSQQSNLELEQCRPGKNKGIRISKTVSKEKNKIGGFTLSDF